MRERRVARQIRLGTGRCAVSSRVPGIPWSQICPRPGYTSDPDIPDLVYNVACLAEMRVYSGPARPGTRLYPVYRYMYVYIHVCMYVCVCVCVGVCVCVCVYLHMYIFMYVCVYAYVYVYIYMYRFFQAILAQVLFKLKNQRTAGVLVPYGASAQP